MTTITVSDIKPKSRKRNGQVSTYVPPFHEVMNAEIVPNKSIRIFGNTNGDAYDVSFKLGDKAVFDSFNMIYTGEIVAIGPSTVTIHWHGKNTRLDLYSFSWRNYDFDAKEIEDKNFETSQYI